VNLLPVLVSSAGRLLHFLSFGGWRYIINKRFNLDGPEQLRGSSLSGASAFKMGLFDLSQKKKDMGLDSTWGCST